MKQSDKSKKDNSALVAKPSEGETREEFTKRVIALMKERGLISKAK
jgi:hypothetical protein